MPGQENAVGHPAAGEGLSPSPECDSVLRTGTAVSKSRDKKRITGYREIAKKKRARIFEGSAFSGCLISWVPEQNPQGGRSLSLVYRI